MPIDYYALSVYPYISNLYLQYGLVGLYYVNHRVLWLSADKLIDEAFDPYAFVRSAYLQRRQQQMDRLAKDGRIPHESSSYVESQSDDSSETTSAAPESSTATTHDDNDNTDTDADVDTENAENK
jgi:ABC-type transporter lipoprotein component MlaA